MRVVVIGCGPAGHAAGLAAARRGADVQVVEAARPGGQCVHDACIPTASLLSAIGAWLEAHEPAVTGVFELGERIDFARAVARKDALVSRVADGVERSLAAAGVAVVPGRATLTGGSRVAVRGADGTTVVEADGIVIATGTRWDPPALPGVPAERVLSADLVQRLPAPPDAAVVLGGGAGATAFAVEYAFLLAAVGTRVTLALPADRLVPALDPELEPMARAVLDAVGVAIVDHATVRGGDAGGLVLETPRGEQPADASIVVAPDVRAAATDALGLGAAGVRTTADGFVAVDDRAATNVAGVHAAGDVTGGAFHTAAAQHLGAVAGTNAAGGAAVVRLHHVPSVLHTVPELAWVGLGEAAAAAAGFEVLTGAVDLGVSARAVTLGGREGAVKLVVDAGLGAILGAHACGPGAAEMVAVAATAMQAELTVDDLAATVQWHPSAAESLVEAARQVVASRPGSVG